MDKNSHKEITEQEGKSEIVAIWVWESWGDTETKGTRGQIVEEKQWRWYRSGVLQHD